MRLRGEAFVECIPEWHSDPSCFRFHVKNIGRDFLRSNGMYAFVHCVPVLISPKFWRLMYGATRSMFEQKENVNGRGNWCSVDYEKCVSSIYKTCLSIIAFLLYIRIFRIYICVSQKPHIANQE